MARGKTLGVDGLVVWKLIAVSFVVIFFFLLTNVSLCTAQQFCDTQVFFTILIGSLVMIVMFVVLQIMDHPKTRSMNEQNLVWFFFRNWSWWKLIWIPVGLALVFVGAYIGSAINQPIMSIAIAGVVLGFALVHTNTVAIPIIIHGLYNSIIIYLRSGTQASLLHTFSLSPSFVPNLGSDLASSYGIINEVVFQVFLVAVAEEIFKVFMITLIIVGLVGNFDTRNKFVIALALLVAISVWVTLHVINNNYS